MSDLPSKELRAALAESNLMDYAAYYHRVGRRFGHLSDVQLNRTWVAAQRARYDANRQDLWPDWRDAEAELLLRGLPRPHHLLRPKTKERILAQSVKDRQEIEANPELKMKIEDFVRRCVARRN